MRKGTGKFLKQEVMITVCDHCGKELSTDYITYDYRSTDGYDNYGDVMEVCSMECLIKEISQGDELYAKLSDHYYFPPASDVRLHMRSDLMKKLLFGE
jgi:hypothetical protein